MIEAWFPTLIYSADMSAVYGEEFNNKVYERAKELRETKPTGQNWNCNTYNTSLASDLHNEEMFKKFVHSCRCHVEEFAAEFDVDFTNTKLDLCGFWINLAPPGGFQEYHVHPDSHFSMVYYAKTHPNCGNIIFRGHEDKNMCKLPVRSNLMTNYGSCFYEAINSRLLIFRSHHEHMVQQNMSGVDRVSIAMNWKFNEINREGV